MIRKEFPAVDERYFEERLENGLLVRVIEKPGFAKKYAFAAVDFGSNDTKFAFDGKVYDTPAGVAHYLEHKMFDLPDGNAMELFAKYGGSNNAFTSYAMTAYYVECTEQFEENLSVLLRMVSTPYFTEESVEKERGIIAQEIKMYDDSADSAVQENLLAAMYEHHPIRVSIAGNVESIRDITAQTLYDCFRAFYDPSNMILCVIGDVKAADVIEQTRRETPASCGARPVRDYGEAEKPVCREKKVTGQMEVSMPTFAIGFKCDAPEEGMEGVRAEFTALMAAEMLIGESSELYTRLYDEGVIDGDFSVDYEYVRGAAMLIASGDSEEPDRILEEMIAEAARIAAEGADEKRFLRLKKSALGRRLRELDGFESICYRMCAYYFDGAEYYDYPAAFQIVTKEDVELFLRDFVIKERAAISIIEPKEET